MENSTTYIVIEKAKASLLNELKTNKIDFNEISENTFEIENSNKTTMAIRLTTERFGQNCLLIKEIPILPANTLERIMYNQGVAFAKSLNEDENTQIQHGNREIVKLRRIRSTPTNFRH